MDKYDVAGLLTTYSKKCILATNTEQLKEFVRELKRELNAEVIKNMILED